MHTFLVIYVGQVIYGVCVCFLLSGYDAIFIQCIMTMSYRFRTMARLLQLLNVTDGRKKEDGRAKDKEIIGLVYNMHCSVLEYDEEEGVWTFDFPLNYNWTIILIFQGHYQLPGVLLSLRISPIGQ